MKTVMANRRWIKEHPDLGTGPVPTETCTSPELFELERDRIFRRTWLNMGREEDLPEPGSYVVRDLAIANTSVLLVRGKDRKIRAFHNVCVHRGNRLVDNENGLCKGRFVCRFHSWAYDTAGQLTWVSDEANFYDIDKSALGLKPIAADLWEGFIFINLNPRPTETLAEYMAGMVQQIHGYPFDQQRLMCRYRVEEKANWKVILDAQNEVYHLPFLHITYPDFCPLNEQKFSRIQNFTRFGRHTAYSVELNLDHKMTPVESIAINANPRGGQVHPSMIGWFDFYTVFPNFCMLFLAGTYVTYNIWPDRGRPQRMGSQHVSTGDQQAERAVCAGVQPMPPARSSAGGREQSRGYPGQPEFGSAESFPTAGRGNSDQAFPQGSSQTHLW